MMKHKGYTGRCKVDPDARIIRGRVVGIRDVITFQGRTFDEARAAFAESVDDYLDFCDQRGERPETPYPGRVRLRLEPETHRELALRAESEGISFDSLVGRILTQHLEIASPS